MDIWTWKWNDNVRNYMPAPSVVQNAMLAMVRDKLYCVNKTDVVPAKMADNDMTIEI